MGAPNNGRLSEYTGKGLKKEIVEKSTNSLSIFFVKNRMLLDKYGMSLDELRRVLYDVYGLKITRTIFYECVKKRRYKVGYWLIITIMHYWQSRGEEMSFGGGEGDVSSHIE